jgi:effector-binding domain-containing protein
MAYTIERRTLAEQPILFMTRRVERSEIAAAIGAFLPQVLGYAMKTGAAIASPPLCRYGEMSPGAGMRLDAGIAVASPASGAGEIRSGTLPAGPVATTIHAGPYDRLSEAYAALEKWMADNNLKPGGDPWEVYLTDPSQVPDSVNWRTEVNWPILA